MRTLPTEVTDALASRRLVARDFLWIVARNRSTGDPESGGFWSDVYDADVDVVDPDTGDSDTRSFVGAGTLISISDIPAEITLTVKTVEIRMSQLNDQVEAMVRTHDAKQARVEIFRGLFDPDTRELVSPAEPRFVGFVDTIEILTPSENEEGGVVLSCTSHTQELTRSNPATRSDADQRTRNATDNFFQDVAVVGEWDRQWGPTTGTVAQERKGLFGLGNFLGFL